MGKTAADFMAELKKDSEYQNMVSIKDKAQKKYWETHGQDEQHLLKDLREQGFHLDSVWDFVNRGNDYQKAIPVLIKHLKIKHHPRIMEGIVRSLAIPNLSNNDELWFSLIELFKNTTPDAKIEDPREKGLQMGVALALSNLSTKQRISDLEILIQKYPNNDGINWLVNKLKKLKK